MPSRRKLDRDRINDPLTSMFYIEHRWRRGATFDLDGDATTAYLTDPSKITERGLARHFAVRRFCPLPYRRSIAFLTDSAVLLLSRSSISRKFLQYSQFGSEQYGDPDLIG